MKIPIYKLEFDSDFTLKYQKGVKSILNSKSISEGNFVKKFEKNYAKFIKSNYSLAVSSGTAALEIAFRAVNPSCKKIIIPTKEKLLCPFRKTKTKKKKTILFRDTKHVGTIKLFFFYQSPRFDLSN